MVTQTDPQTLTGQAMTDTPRPCPPWCGWKECDGFHMSGPTYVPTVEGAERLDVSLIRDDTDGPGSIEVGVNVSTAASGGACAGLTPAQVLEFVALLRNHALAAAGRDGLDMPVELVRLGEQIHIAGRWETVELLTADGWCCGVPPKPGHRCRVVVGTDAHGDDAHQYQVGQLVQVRHAPAGGDR